MKKSIQNIGQTLNRFEQQSIQGGGTPNTTQITPNRHYWEHTGPGYPEVVCTENSNEDHCTENN